MFPKRKKKSIFVRCRRTYILKKSKQENIRCWKVCTNFRLNQFGLQEIFNIRNLKNRY